MIDFKLEAQKILLKSIISGKSRIGSKKSKLISATPLLNTGANASRLTIDVTPSFEEEKLRILESFSYSFKEDLFCIIDVMPRYFDKILKWLLTYKYITLSNKKECLIALCWLGSKSWEKSHKLTLDYLKNEVDLLLTNDINWMGKIENWALPKLTSSREKNQVIINNFINNIP